MLRMRNNDVYISRGETTALNFKVWNTDGTPFILPPRPEKDLSLKALANIENYDDHSTYVFHCPIFMNEITVNIETADISHNIIVEYIKDGAYKQIQMFHGSKAEIIGFVTSITVKNDSISSISYTYGNNKLKNILITNILPSNDIAVLVFTIKAGTYDKIVRQKIINGSSAIIQNGKTDYSPNGLNKFTTTKILEMPSIVELTLALENQYPEVIQVGKVGDNYYHLAYLKDGTFQLMPYEFNINIPLEHSDTNLDAREYTYDFIAYRGKADDKMFTDDQLCFEKIDWKKELIGPHKFIIGDSHNA